MNVDVPKGSCNDGWRRTGLHAQWPWKSRIFLEGQQCGLVFVPGHPRRAGPSSGNLQAGLSRELPSKKQLQTIRTDEVMGVMTRKRRVKQSPRDILKRRMDHGLWSPSIQLHIPPPWNPRGALPSYVPSWLRPPGLHGFCNRHPWEPLGVVRLVNFWAQMLTLSVPGRTGVYVQPHRGHRCAHHAQGLCHSRVASQPGAAGIPGLHEVRGHPGVEVLGVKLGAPPRGARALSIRLTETSGNRFAEQGEEAQRSWGGGGSR